MCNHLFLDSRKMVCTNIDTYHGVHTVNLIVWVLYKDMLFILFNCYFLKIDTWLSCVVGRGLFCRKAEEGGQRLWCVKGKGFCFTDFHLHDQRRCITCTVASLMFNR